MKTDRIPRWVRRLLNFVGRRRGYAGCYRCGDSWYWKMAHSTQYTTHRGCFPLCEDCHRFLGHWSLRLPFYEALWESWERQGADDLTPELWIQIKSAVMAGK